MPPVRKLAQVAPVHFFIFRTIFLDRRALSAIIAFPLPIFFDDFIWLKNRGNKGGCE